MAVRKYTPRRFGARWRDATCPEYVLDCFDNGPNVNPCERFDVLFGGSMVEGDGTYAGTWISGIAMGADGWRAPSFGLSAREAARYRYRMKRRRTRWDALPQCVRDYVCQWAEED